MLTLYITIILVVIQYNRIHFSKFHLSLHLSLFSTLNFSGLFLSLVFLSPNLIILCLVKVRVILLSYYMFMLMILSLLAYPLILLTLLIGLFINISSSRTLVILSIFLDLKLSVLKLVLHFLNASILINCSRIRGP